MKFPHSALPALALLAVFAVPAVADWAALSPEASCRDALMDTGAGGIVAAVQDAGALWLLDPQSGDRVREVPVGGAPVSLALNAGRDTVACVNNLDATLTLLSYPALAVRATLAVSGGPVAVCATADNRFIVADPHDNRLLLLDPAGAGSAATLAGDAGVPAAVASAGEWAGWIGRAETALMLLNFNDPKAAVRRVSLPAPPVAVCALSNGRFVVASSAALYVVSPENGRILSTVAMPVEDLSAGDGVLAVLGGGEVRLLDETLSETGRMAVEIPAKRVRCGNGMVAVLAPQARSGAFWVRGAVSTPQSSVVPVVEAAPVTAEAVATEVAAAEVAAAEVAAAEVAAAEVAAAEAVTAEVAATEVAATEVVATEALAAEDETDRTDQTDRSDRLEVAETAPAVAETAPAAAEPVRAVSPAEEKPKGQFRSMPMFTGTLRAPSLRQPTYRLMGRAERRSLRDALARPIEFGEPGLGFSPPDWTEPLRDVEADSMTTELTTGRTVLRDNVRLRLGEMYFRSDRFTYSDEEASYEAAGNVLVEQHQSRLTAEEVTYHAPPLEVAEKSFVLEPRDEQALAKRRLSMGRLTGRNLHITEPTRELRADAVDYDFAAQKGELTNARGQAAYFYYSAEKLHILGPEDIIAENVWVTTCPGDPPQYRILLDELVVEKGEAVSGKGAKLQLGRSLTLPAPLPLWKNTSGPYPWSLDFDSGRFAEIGSYVNVGQQFEVSPELSLGPRVMPTTKEGVGLGGDMAYDYMNKPSSRLYRTSGEMHGLWFTQDRGYFEWFHRFEYDKDLVLRAQAEQWSDELFYKDYFYDRYRHRTSPRTFGNVTLRKEDFIATGTARFNTHSWTAETERLPEATFHMIERPLVDRLMVSFDTVDGYNDRNPGREYGLRSVNIARLTYDMDPFEGLSVTPFYEVEGSYYQRQRLRDDSASRFSNTVGVTLQTRLHKEYPGMLGFSAFKHVIVPSVTYSYRPESTLAADRAPRFDALDNVYGRSRIESKISNIIYGRDAETNDVWQAGRLTLYQGNDFWNEIRKADDYEVELDIRPRPWWGMQLAGERHEIANPESLQDQNRNFFERRFYDLYERFTGEPFSERATELNLQYADYSRILTQLYYDGAPVGGRFNTRIGYAYSDTEGRIYNRDILYGLG
ncbi:MAG: LPS assembly protein LptD [Candidatus Hydrogenedens sp.]|nr:LPS assembly protein LptD [Candidatus Hydrogenedens sp.]